MIRSFAAHVAREIEARAETIRSQILGGNPQDFAQYRHAAGQLRGLEIALQTLTDLAKKAEDNE